MLETAERASTVIGVLYQRGILADGREIAEVVIDDNCSGPREAEALFRALGAAIDAELPPPYNREAAFGHFTVGATPEVWETITGQPNVHLAPLAHTPAA